MNTIKARISEEVKDFMQSSKGKIFEWFQCDPIDENSSVYMAVWFSVNGRIIRLKNELHNFKIIDQDDLAVLSAEFIEEQEICSYLQDVKPERYFINKELLDFKIVRDNIDIFEDNKKVINIDFDTAIIFQFTNNELVFEKEIWFSEEINIYQGEDAEKNIRNISNDFEYEKPFRSEINRIIS